MAGQIPPDPEADDFHRNWVRPAQALLYLAPMGAEAAASEIYRRLCNGMLFAAGSASALKASGPTDPRQVIIPPWWESVPITKNPASSLWLAAGVTVTAKGAMDSRRQYEFFGVRFEPYGLQRLADDVGLSVKISPMAVLVDALAANQALEERQPRPAHDGDEVAPRKPVSAATLQAWWELCKTLKAADAWTMDELRAFFAQCLPDKSVSRDQLRDVRGARSRDQSALPPNSGLCSPKMTVKVAQFQCLAGNLWPNIRQISAEIDRRIA